MDLASEGLLVVFSLVPPLFYRDFFPESFITVMENFSLPNSLVRDWEQRGLLTRDLIPAEVSSVIFFCQQKNGKFYPMNFGLSGLASVFPLPYFGDPFS